MSTPANSFDDLRSILGKLDRKIDKARSKRLGLDEEPAANHTLDEPTIGKSDPASQETLEEQQIGQTTLSEAAARQRSPFGRAKPLNRNGSGPQTHWMGGGGIG